MSWQGVHIANPARLSLAQKNLCVEQNGKEAVLFPVEDLAYIIIDTPMVDLTAPLLSACAQAGCLVLFIDAQHLPVGALYPVAQYFRQLDTVRAQLAFSRPQQKRLWQSLIQQKICNQAACLMHLGYEKEAQKIAALSQKVASGDTQNTEAYAARLYWQYFAPNFQRKQDSTDTLNALLNYGYALLRSALARELVALGFLPALGIHHCNLSNGFNLADDCVEPWRPFIDAWALTHWQSLAHCTRNLTTADKHHMCGIFQQRVCMDDEVLLLLQGMRQYISSVHKYMTGASRLSLPNWHS